MQLRAAHAWALSLPERGWSVAQGREALHAAACFLAISLSFLVYGVLQERMMTIGFGPDRELFKFSLFIVFCNRLLTTGIAFLVQLVQQGSVMPVAPLQAYAAVSCGNLIASTCQYDSLKYISFALQTLAKCCKMLPVMLWGALIRRKRYTAAEIATAASVTAGCAMFIFSGSILSSAADAAVPAAYYTIGCLLLLAYLCFDGFASTWQDTLFSAHDMDTSNQVLYTALCSTAFSLVVLVSSHDLVAALAFLRRHPNAMVYITAVSSVATIIQYFVSYTIKTYGALNFATLMTARQFLSVIASSVIFKHQFSAGQWMGTAVVFGSLGLKMFNKQRSRTKVSTPRSASEAAKLAASPARTPPMDELHTSAQPFGSGAGESAHTIPSTPITTAWTAAQLTTPAGRHSPQHPSRASARASASGAFT